MRSAAAVVKLTKDVALLKVFSDHLVHQATQLRERSALVDVLIPVSRRTDVFSEILAGVERMAAVYPGFAIDVNLINNRSCLAVNTGAEVAQETTMCRYSIASGAVLSVDDSLEDAIVCDNPYAQIVRSYLGAPIVVRGWVVGVCCMHGPHVACWAQVDRDRVAAWAKSVSSVLEMGFILPAHGP